jgi:TadE-like protein
MPRIRTLLLDQSGASAAEFTIVALLFCGLIFGTIDFGRLLWNWNQAEAATRAGARFAIVNAPVAGGITTINGISLGHPQGEPIPVSAINGGNPIICTSSATTATCNSYSPASQTAFDNIVRQVWLFFPNIGSNNDGTINLAVARTKVQVEYRHVGLGFSGNPFGSDIIPLVTVRLRPTTMTFDFITPGLVGIASIAMPGFAATLPGEDLN